MSAASQLDICPKNVLPLGYSEELLNLSPGKDIEGTVEVGVDAFEEVPRVLSAARASLMSKFLLGLRSVSSRNCEIKLNLSLTARSPKTNRAVYSTGG